ncbi:SdpI family protein [Anoxybacillus sp. LAT_35]|uniref:SdpI family protein n=1 Tax=unclassified Anoxybacillus TaxID=2639704 RepID=UPI001EDA8BEC|nr:MULTISPECIES: SdpI family protein [unclassified Anoxybacillus]MCG5026067.1 SdpI family protein [Anoxybacillus flavithermus]MCG6195999.1 SdpI family protein [Anoxybacillus sp. LAT_38]MCG3084212.1 SdpI family protein [Anoxybacillus sp. LAT27]MCG6170559.1 SdpI family protein [Anoxybacillus sp. LAT_11]MCG6174700.1 SdpI family protein [Anoxybacillus sp. LAT_31]
MKKHLFIIILIACSYVLSLLAIPFLPSEVAIHWNAAGEADGFTNKWWGALLFPLFLTGITFLLIYLPKIDPRKENYEKFKNVYLIFLHVLVIFFVILHVMTLAYNVGFSVQVDIVVPIGVGVLFIVLGNYMPKIKPNYFIGIRTPWTLDNETVWQKTHRVGGKVFVMMGVLVMLTIFVESVWRFVLLLIIVFGGTIYLFVQSYIFSRQ